MAVQVHMVVPDLLLPGFYANEVLRGVHLPALEKLLARAQRQQLPAISLENWLCNAFGVADAAIAPVTLMADGIEPGSSYWLRADPVYLRIDHDRMLVQPVAQLEQEQAELFCASLNRHFADAGLDFLAPHPLRWYLRLESAPRMSAQSIAEISGKDASRCLPRGEDALHWHSVLNEVQMLLFEHPLNQEREQNGIPAVGGIWLWGGGSAVASLRLPAARMITDSDMAAAFAGAAGVPCSALSPNPVQYACADDGNVLVVWEGLRLALLRGDFSAWQEALLALEHGWIAPVQEAMSRGAVEKITLDVLQENACWRFVLTRLGAHKFWRRRRPLPGYSGLVDA